MSSSYYKLEISNRIDTGTKGAKKERRKGLVPGVLYYSGEDATNISIKKSNLLRAMNSGQRIFEILQEGESQYTMLKQVQYHPVTDEIIHLDFMRVRRSEKMTISVPLVLVGKPIGVVEGGILSQALNQIEISCFPTNVPDQIEVNVDKMELNSSISVADVSTDDEEVEILSSSEINIATITAPSSEKEETVPDDDTVTGEVKDESSDDQKSDDSDNEEESKE